MNTGLRVILGYKLLQNYGYGIASYITASIIGAGLIHLLWNKAKNSIKNWQDIVIYGINI